MTEPSPVDNFRCEKKQRFPCREVATFTANKIEAKYRKQGKREQLRAYRCPSCRRYHLTSQKREAA